MTALTLLIGYCLNTVTLVVNKQWREMVMNNVILRQNDVARVEVIRLREKGEILI